MQREDKISTLTKILEINDTIEKDYFRIRFKDENHEKEYSEFLLKDLKNANLLISFLFLILEIYREFFTEISKNFTLALYINSISLSITSFLFILILFIKNINRIKIINFLFSIIIQIKNACSVILMFYFYEIKNEGDQIRELYVMFFFYFSKELLSEDMDFLKFLFYLSINVGVCIYLTLITYGGVENLRFKDIIFSFSLLIVCNILKRFNSLLKRDNYIQNVKLNKYFSYCFDLINSMNGLQFTIKDSKILLYNEMYKKYIAESKLMKNIDRNLYNFNIENKIATFFEKSGEIKKNEENKNLINDVSINKKTTDKQFFYKKIKSHQKLNEILITNIKNKFEANFNVEETKNIYKKNYLQMKKKNKYFCDIFKKKEKKEINKISNQICGKIKQNELYKNSKENIELNISCKRNNNKKIDESSIELNLLNIKNSNEKNYNMDNKNPLKNQLKDDIPILKNLSYLNKKEENRNTSKLLKENVSNINIGNSVKKYSFERMFSYLLNEIGEYYLSNFKIVAINKKFKEFEADNLYEIYKKIDYYNKEKRDIEIFEYLGDFSLEEDNRYFQIYFRKHSNYNDLIDFLIYDLTEVKVAKDIEFNLKSKFFAKIAHEFKTPINSIIGLIKKLSNYDIEFKKNHREFKKTLNQIENLSNYVVFLISDIIDYSNFHSSNQVNEKIDDNNNLNNENKINDNQISQKINLNIENINLKQITSFCRD